MSKYEVNIKRFALLLVPTFWRRPILATLAYAMVSPLGYLHTRFVLFRRDTVYRLTHNGQVCYLRAVLNDQFDPIERRITITEEAAGAGVLMLHKREEEQAFRMRTGGPSDFAIRHGGRLPVACDRWHVQIGVKEIFGKLHLRG